MPSQRLHFEGLRSTIASETGEIIPGSLDFFRRLVKHTLTGLEPLSRPIHLSHGRLGLLLDALRLAPAQSRITR